MSTNDEWTTEAAEAESEAIDVKVSTEGARHVSAGELRERAVLEANGWSIGETYEVPPDVSLSKILADNGLLCSAETRVKRNLHNHTHRCQKLDGHEGGHEWQDGAGRTIIWYGEAKPLPTDMRYRFGLDPHWMMARPGRKTMANDFDSEW